MMSSFKSNTQTVSADFLPTASHHRQAASSADSQSVAMLSRPVVFEARSIFSTHSAEAESAEQLENAWTPERLESLEQEAFLRGADSARNAVADTNRLLETLNSADRGLEQVAATAIGANRALLLELAMEMARRWVGEELKLDPALFGGVLDRAIDSLAENDGAVLALHPLDHAALAELDPERITDWLETQGLQIEEDETVARSSFRLVGPGQRIDGSSDAVLERLRNALSDAFDANLPEATS